MADKAKKKKSTEVTRSVETSSLAVKYRPRTIDEIVGQDAVATQVRGMVKAKRFPSTIGLFGESGSGKTTIARMIARYVNCSKPSKEDNSPCGECVNCRYESAHPDVHEINMAINRGIDDVRAITQSAQSMPTIGNKRVFILDEMHACFPMSTNVLRSDGSIISFAGILGELQRAQEVGVEPNIWVQSMNNTTGLVEPKRVVAIIPKRVKGSSMRCTYVHQMGAEAFFYSTGDHPMRSDTVSDFKPVDELEPGECLTTSVDISTAVVRVEDLYPAGGPDAARADEMIDVCDITVEDNHNFFIVPVGGSAGVLAKNCTPQSMQAILKPLEEPPANTIWILATTDPQKLPDTIRGRCHKFQIKPIAEEAIIKRLRVIGRREGVDFKEIDGGKEILATIAGLNNGRMRDSIAALEGVLFALKANPKLDSKALIADFARNADADLEKLSAQLFAYILSGNLTASVKSVLESGNVRGLLSKSRWLLQTLTLQGAGLNFFRSYSWRCFAALVKSEGLSPKLPDVLEVQNLLCNIELELNSNSIDEGVLFASRLSEFMRLRSVKAVKTKKSDK